MKLKYYINLNKGITFLVMLILLFYFKQWNNPAAWLYLSLHGTYGFLWVIKSRIFPDKAWEKKVSVWFGILSWFSLLIYWIPGYILMSRNIQVPAWYLGLCSTVYIFGVFFHFTSDMQKNVMLEIHPGNLITDRMMSLSRNINYFGEFLIYLSLALLSMTWITFIPLISFMVFYWSFNIIKKEKSLSMKPGFSEYKEKVKFFIPFIF
jgi:steroid 5-alpha reductase family enzyme